MEGLGRTLRELYNLSLVLLDHNLVRAGGLDERSLPPLWTRPLVLSLGDDHRLNLVLEHIEESSGGQLSSDEKTEVLRYIVRRVVLADWFNWSANALVYVMRIVLTLLDVQNSESLHESTSLATVTARLGEHHSLSLERHQVTRSILSALHLRVNHTGVLCFRVDVVDFGGVTRSGESWVEDVVDLEDSWEDLVSTCKIASQVV